MKKIALAFIVSCFFLSCEKDKLLVIENTDIPLISKVLIGGEIYMEYSYNSANLPSEEKSKFHYSKHNYNDRNQLITSDFYWDISMASSDSRVIEAAMQRTEWVNPDNTPKSISHSYKYNGDEQLVRKSYVRPGEKDGDFSEFVYDGDRIVKEIFHNENSISGYLDYLYDDIGNIIKQSRYFVSSAGIAELSTTTEYEYDNMHNPYLSFKRMVTPGIYTNPNNVTKETMTLNFEVFPSIEKVQVIKNSYEYNDNGYPVKINGLTEYIYK
jgi:hypothetical protein